MRKRPKSRAPFATRIPIPIAGGEMFADGSAIELVRQIGNPECPSLLFWNGSSETVAPAVEREGRLYEPAAINSSIWRDLTLPTHSVLCRSARDLLADLSRSVSHFVGLSEILAAIVARAVLVSWIIRALPVAPAVSIVGPDGPRGNRLMQWLRCTCRHSLPISGLTPAALRSLPSAMEFTLLISQSAISDKLEKLLDDAARRDQKIPHRGGLLDLYGLQVIHSESVLGAAPRFFRSLRVPVSIGAPELPIFDIEVQRQIATDLQPRLLGYRLTNFRKASASGFDASRFTHQLRDLGHNLAAASPDDVDLQAELFGLLRREDTELQSEKWIAVETVAVESVLFACQEWPGKNKYIGELAEIAQEIWQRRGDSRTVDPGAFGKWLDDLEFTKEKRDAKGVALHLSNATRDRARQLARDLNIPEVERAVWPGAAARAIDE